MTRAAAAPDKPAQAFGGDWTEEKLDILQKYLWAFTTSLKKRHFTLLYIDAFAGTGYREMPANPSNHGDPSAQFLFEEQSTPEAEAFFDGSARIAMQTTPPFDRLVFVERSRRRFAQLEAAVLESPDRREEVELVNADCNTFLPALCARTDWRPTRAVLFLDPFGMDVEWRTMQAVAATQAIDVWILFPVGVGVNRLLTGRLADMDPKWAERLTAVFGTEEWRDALYKKRIQTTLLDGNVETVEKHCNCRMIVDYYLNRLKTIFPGVASNPRFLCNSKQSPMFALCFAMGNPSHRARALALKIAGDILKS